MSTSPRRPLTFVPIGGPTILIEYGGLRILTDPTFDAGQTEYHNTPGLVLTKLTGPAIPLAELGSIDLVLLSHEQHRDNLDDSGRELLNHVTTTITTVDSAERLGHIATGLAPWEYADYPLPDGGMLRVTATPARHGPIGIEPITGHVTGFLLTDLSTGEDLVYVTGDTVWFEGTAEVAKRSRPRVCLPFAGAARPRGPMHLTMSVNDVVELANVLPESKQIPIHHEGWAHFSESQADLIGVFTALRIENRLIAIEPGVPITVS